MLLQESSDKSSGNDDSAYVRVENFKPKEVFEIYIQNEW